MDLHLPTKRSSLLELSAQDSLQILIKDVQKGLLKPPRSLPPKYFYDEKGSELFDEICKTKDYYPTKTERGILEANAKDVVNLVKPNTIVELGAGTSAKTGILFSYLNHYFTYYAIDVCKEVLLQSAKRILNKFDNISVNSLVAEYIPALLSLEKISTPTLFMFLGSSIGNFSENEAIEVLKNVALKMHQDDYFLIGFDRVKDRDVLERAYDDKQGITAEFNLNVLNVLNKELDANFVLDHFSHQAIYNNADEQIEMYLISTKDQLVNISALNESIHLGTNEKILTEISRKYTKESINHLLEKSGLHEKEHYESSNKYFSLVLAARSD